MLIWKTTLIAAAVSAALLGCTPQSPGTALVIEEKVYPVTPSAVTVKTGIVTAELTDMKVTERIEKNSARIDTPAKLTAKLKLQNSSPDQTVRLISGKMVYPDTLGQPIKIEEARTEPVIRFTSVTSTSSTTSASARSWFAISFSASRIASGVSRMMRRFSFSSIYTSRVLRIDRMSVSACFASVFAR